MIISLKKYFLFIPVVGKMRIWGGIWWGTGTGDVSINAEVCKIQSSEKLERVQETQTCHQHLLPQRVTALLLFKHFQSIHQHHTISEQALHQF